MVKHVDITENSNSAEFVLESWPPREKSPGSLRQAGNYKNDSTLKNPQMQGATKRPRRRYGNSVAQGSAGATPQMRLFQQTTIDHGRRKIN